MMAIATNTKVYAEFPALGHWYDSKRLFDYLSDNDSIRNAFPVLQNFYNIIVNNAIAIERSADDKLRELIRDFANYSPPEREAQLEDAGDENEDIDISEIQDENEQRINGIYLRMVRWGLDSLLEEDKEFIHLLAPQCPYVGGSAVYKARTLNYFIEPGAMYDDMKTCNAVGVYKPGNGSASSNSSISLITLEDEALSQIKSNPDVLYLNEHQLIVYPKPAINLVYAKYNETAPSELKISDMTGRVVMNIALPSGENKVEINIENLVSGVYSYKQVIAGKIQNSGKIIKD